MKRQRKRIIAVAASVLFAAGCVSPALMRADAAPAPAPLYAAGADSSEIMLLDESPVVLSHEKLVLDARGSANEFFSSFENIAVEYPAYFTTEYTLDNPTETDQTLRLAYTLGMLPDYAFWYAYEKDCETMVSFSADGAKLSFRTKYAYDCNDFGEVTDPFFAAETPMTDQAFTVSLPADRDKEENYLLRAECEYNPARTRLVVPESFRSSQYENGRLAVYLWIRDETQTVSITSLGEEAKITSLTVVPNNYGDIGEPLSGASAERGKVFRTTFGGYVTGWFASNGYPFGEENALRCGAQYYTQLYESAGNVFLGDLRGFYQSFLSRRFEYELIVPAGGRVTHTVKAPLFPQIDEYGCNYVYDFTPAYGWKEYGGLSVELRTDGASKLRDTNFEFATDAGVMNFSRESLPMGSLSFGLCPISMNCGPREIEPNGISGDLIAAFVILGVLAAVGITIAVIAIVRKKRRNAGERGGNS